MKYKTVPGVILTSICDSHFLVAPEETIKVNETAAFFWKKLEQGASVDELVELADESYEIDDMNKLKDDIRDLVDTLMEKHFLVRYGS